MTCVNVSLVEEWDIFINITRQEGFNLHMATKFDYKKFLKILFM